MGLSDASGPGWKKMKTLPTELLVYYCHNLQLFKNGKRKAVARAWPGVKLVALPCSGKVEAYHLLKALASGVQGVMVLGCAERACQFLEGSLRSQRRLQYARSWLDELGIEAERLQFSQLGPTDEPALEAILRDFTGRLQTFGTISASSTF